MPERNLDQQNDPVVIEWARRVPIDQVSGSVVVPCRALAGRNRSHIESREQRSGRVINREAVDLSSARGAPECTRVLSTHRGTVGSNTKRQARQIRPIQIERGRADTCSEPTSWDIECPFFYLP